VIARLTPLLLPLLVVDSALLALVEVMFLQLFVGPVPVPLSAALAAVSLPWLVWWAGKIGGTPASATMPVVAWLVTVALLGFAGPGDDVLLPLTWPMVVQTVLLLVGGLVPGVFTLARVRREMVEHPEGWRAGYDYPVPDLGTDFPVPGRRGDDQAGAGDT
jgi:hypothetical protein